ncbi:MAG: phage tail protein [Chloroflexi bacterium]|nr:phage tail protein [Chloroflexota bacterium]
MAETAKPPEAHGVLRFAIKIDDDETFFAECTLPSLEVDVLEQKEGGYNQATHLISGPVKAGRITLKNGFTTSRAMLQWYLDVASGHRKKAERNVSIVLFDSAGDKVMHLAFAGAYPVKWSGPAFKAGDNSAAIQTLELAFAEFSLES